MILGLYVATCGHMSYRSSHVDFHNVVVQYMCHVMPFTKQHHAHALVVTKLAVVWRVGKVLHVEANTRSGHDSSYDARYWHAPVVS